MDEGGKRNGGGLTTRHRRSCSGAHWVPAWLTAARRSRGHPPRTCRKADRRLCWGSVLKAYGKELNGGTWKIWTGRGLPFLRPQFTQALRVRVFALVLPARLAILKAVSEGGTESGTAAWRRIGRRRGLYTCRGGLGESRGTGESKVTQDGVPGEPWTCLEFPGDAPCRWAFRWWVEWENSGIQ